MPGFNVADLIGSGVLQPSERLDGWNNSAASCESKGGHPTTTFAADCLYHESNSYEGLASLIRTVLHHHQQQQQQQAIHTSNQCGSSAELDAAAVVPDSKSNRTTVTAISTDSQSSIGNKLSQTTVSPSLADLTTDPTVWQRLLYVSPELNDYFFFPTCGRSRALDCSPEGTCHSATGSSFPPGKRNAPSHVEANTFDVPGSGHNARGVASPGNGPPRTASMTEFLPWWESHCAADLFGSQTQRALYLTTNYCNSMFGGSTKSNLFFPPADLRKPKRIRTAFSPAQLYQLENTFERNHYVVGQERKDLAAGLGLTETQVKVWFQNRRTKFKRMRMDDPDQSTSTCGAEPESPDAAGSGHPSDEGLDLSNDQSNPIVSGKSNNLEPDAEQQQQQQQQQQKQRISSSVPLVQTDGSIDSVEGATHMSSHPPKPRFGLELLLHGCKTSKMCERALTDDCESGDAAGAGSGADPEDRSDWNPGAKDYSHRPAYTSDRSAYATHGINSHLFGISG